MSERDPSHREDLSRFLVHLTRDSGETDARGNLITILRDKTIEARNGHCLFLHEFGRLGFTKVLTECFNTVCFTETPLTQIHRLTGKIRGRRVELKGYGLVFAKDWLIEKGACPAVYLNARGTNLREYLLSRFRSDFQTVKSLKTFRKRQLSHFRSIIQYYSLINIIGSNYDFAWEREWRYSGALKFKYRDLVAIVAENPASFESYCKQELPSSKLKFIKRLPIVSPGYSYEDVVEAMSFKIWNDAVGYAGDR